MSPQNFTLSIPLFCCVALAAVCCTARAEPEAVTDQAESPGGSIDSDILGRTGGRVHPFISAAVTSIDNYQYVETNKASDLITTISPGVWLSLSRLKEQPETVATSSMIPGGQAMPAGISEGVRQLHTFAMYRGDFDFYSTHSEDNTNQHHLAGVVQYSMPGGLTVGVDDQFAKGFDPRSTGNSTEIEQYTNNLTGLNVDYKISERLQLAARLSNFLVDYLDARNDYRDRNDKYISLSLPFALTAKTSIFTGYSLTDVTYDSSAENDSKDNDFFVGLSWKMTGKSNGLVQVGYGMKSFDSPSISTKSYLSLGANLSHTLSSRSSVQLSGFRKTEESPVSTSDYMLTDTVSASYSHSFTARWAAAFTAGYEQDAYMGNTSDDRKDTILSLQPALRFFWGNRLSGELGYSLQDRDSSQPEFVYRVNSVMARLEYAL